MWEKWKRGAILVRAFFFSAIWVITQAVNDTIIRVSVSLALISAIRKIFDVLCRSERTPE